MACAHASNNKMRVASNFTLFAFRFLLPRFKMSIHQITGAYINFQNIYPPSHTFGTLFRYRPLFYKIFGVGRDYSRHWLVA